MPEGVIDSLFVKGALRSNSRLGGPISSDDRDIVLEMEDIFQRNYGDLLVVRAYESHRRPGFLRSAKPFYKAAIDVELDLWGWGMQFSANRVRGEKGAKNEFYFQGSFPLDGSNAGKAREPLLHLIKNVTDFYEVEKAHFVHMDKKTISDVRRALRSGGEGVEYLSRWPVNAIHDDNVDSPDSLAIEKVVDFLSTREII